MKTWQSSKAQVGPTPNPLKCSLSRALSAKIPKSVSHAQQSSLQSVFLAAFIPLSKTSYAMANEKTKGHKLPNFASAPLRNEEFGAFYRTNSSADNTGIFDDLLPLYPSFQTGDMQGMLQHYTHEMPSTIQMMNEFSHFGFSDHPATDHDYLYRSVSDISKENVNEMFGYPPTHALADGASLMSDGLENSNIDRTVERTLGDVTRGLEMITEAGKANISCKHSSWLTGNQISHGDGTSVPSSSCFIRNTTHSASDWQQNLPRETLRNFSFECSPVTPFIEVTSSNSGQDRSAKPAESQSPVVIQLSETFSTCACSTGQDIPPVNAPPQVSSDPHRPSRKRGATGSSHVIPQASHRKIRVARPSNHSSTTNIAQVSPLPAPFPQPWTSPLKPQRTQHAHSSLVESLPNVAQSTPPHTPLVSIPSLRTTPVQTPHPQQALSVPNVAQMAPPYEPLPLAWIPPGLQPLYPRAQWIAQSPLNLVPFTPPPAPLIWIPPLCRMPIQRAHIHLAPSVPYVAQMSPQHAPSLLPRTLPSPHLIQTAHQRLILDGTTRVTVSRNPLPSQSQVQIAPQCPVQRPLLRPPMVQNTSLSRPLVHSARHVQPLPNTITPAHVKWKDPDKTPQLGEYQCDICKRGSLLLPIRARETASKFTNCCCTAMTPPLS